MNPENAKRFIGFAASGEAGKPRNLAKPGSEPRNPLQKEKAALAAFRSLTKGSGREF